MVRGEAQLIAGGPEGADPMGGGLGDMQSGSLYRLEAANLPLGAWLFVRVLAANAVGWGPPQVRLVRACVRMRMPGVSPLLMDVSLGAVAGRGGADVGAHVGQCLHAAQSAGQL